MFATKGTKILTPKIEVLFCTFLHKSELALSGDAKNGPFWICPCTEATLERSRGPSARGRGPGDLGRGLGAIAEVQGAPWSAAEVLATSAEVLATSAEV